MFASRCNHVFALCLGLLSGSCQYGAGGNRALSQPLAPPSSSVQADGKYEPSHPFVQIAPAVWSETVFDAPLKAGLHLEVREFLVLPNESLTEFSLAGAAILQVRSGNGVLSVVGQHQTLHPGSVVSVSQDETLAIANLGGDPMRLRVQLFVGK